MYEKYITHFSTCEFYNVATSVRVNKEVLYVFALGLS